MSYHNLSNSSYSKNYQKMFSMEFEFFSTNSSFWKFFIEMCIMAIISKQIKKLRYYRI